jgi:hypothetical protein
VRRTLRRPGCCAQFGDATVGLAFTLAAVWSLHPRQIRAVTCTVQPAESRLGFFYPLTL